MLLLFLLLTGPAQAASYQCTTEYGETVPLGLAVTDSGRTKKGGEAASAKSSAPTYPSLRWNESARRAPGPTKTKRVRLTEGNHEALFETRYRTQPGPSFLLNVSCADGKKCAGTLGEGGTSLELAAKPLLDERAKFFGQASLVLTNREHLNLLVRLQRTGEPTGNLPPLSASGELKIFREDPLFIQDVGVDEWIAAAPGFYVRRAAFEIKLRCRRSD